MSMITQRNIGAIIDQVRAGAASTLTAGGAGDATAVVGSWIDRNASLGTNGSLPMTAAFGVAYTATLAAGKALNLALLIEDSADGSTPGPYQTIAAAQAAVSAAGGAVTGCYNWQVSLTSARRYVRFTWTPHLTAASTDTAAIFLQCSLGGFANLPAPN